MKSLDAIERMTGLKMMKIAFNGALIEHNGKLIRDVRLSREAFIKAIEFLKGKASALIAFTPDSYAIMADDFWLEEQDRILTNVLSLTLVTRTSVEGVVRCRDADDEKFLNLAFESRADFLFTKDKNVLRSGRRLAALGIKTQKPAEFDGL